MKHILSILFVLTFLCVNAQSEHLSLHGFKNESILKDTSEVGIHLHMPNDIISVIPVTLLDGKGMMWVITSDIGTIIYTIGCECDVKWFLDMITENPITKEQSRDSAKFYAKLIQDKWE